MKLLIEKMDFSEIEVLVEETAPTQKNYFIKGPFVQCEIFNRNKRKYPKEIVSPEIGRYIKEVLELNSALGELNHPPNPSINLDRVSHKIISLEESGNDYIGKAKVLDTPMGRIVKNLMDETIRFGVSSRALGSTRLHEGKQIVCSDFFLVTPADIVSDPSAPDAFVQNLMEGKEWVWEAGRLIQYEAQIKKDVDTLARTHRLTEENVKKIFEYALSKI